jgi:hypothetical protein
MMITEKMTSNQRKQIVRFVEDGIDAMNLQKDGAQRLIENGGEFQAELKKLVERFSITNQYADEEVESSYGYLSGYKPNSKSMTEQTNRLRELFPGIGYANEKLAEATLPENAEGWFAIPRWEKVAPTYGEAVQKVLDLIKQTRNGAFYNYREGELGSNQLRQSAKTVSIFQKLGDEQKDQDILVVPAQFGIRHRGDEFAPPLRMATSRRLRGSPLFFSASSGGGGLGFGAGGVSPCLRRLWLGVGVRSAELMFELWGLESFDFLILESLRGFAKANPLFYCRRQFFIFFDIIVIESRLVYSSSRIAITELFLL